MARFGVTEANPRQDLWARGAIALLAILVCAGALRIIPVEFAAHKIRAAGAMGPYRATISDLTAPAASIDGIYAQLEICDAALGDLVTLLQPREKRSEVARDCLVFADQVVRQSPALSFAHLVRAAALTETGDLPAAKQALALSAATAGNTIAAAQRRAALWAKQFATLSAPEQAAFARDIQRLAVKDSGVAWIASQYSATASMQPFITQTMKTVPNARQSAFLAALRRLNQ